MDSYYQPPEPWRETEEKVECPACEETTWHLVTVWEKGGTVHGECTECARTFEDEPSDWE